jgi:hypothetical protein
MGVIIGLISTVLLWVSVVPIVIIAIKAVKFRKNRTKQLVESFYKTIVICSSMIFVFGFIALVSFKMESEINNIFLLFGNVLLELLLKLWVLPVVIFIFRKELKKFSN